MTERQEIEQAIAALDKQRNVLGDTAVETAIAALNQSLNALSAHDSRESTLVGERRIVTILFCDVKGSTSIAEKLDPEVWASIIKRMYGHLIPPVTHQGGTVAQLLGDAILAFFGAPTAHEDDPLRAVKAGLEIIENISAFRNQLQREQGIDFNVRVGINTGLVFVGAIGSDQRIEYTAVGDTINLAARMEQTARPGSVQITEHTFKLVEPWFEFEPLGATQVKGKSEPVNAYRVLSVRSRPGRIRGLEGLAHTSPLVGRNHELNQIQLYLERLSREREGGIVGIIGEAGVGKSRLLQEVKSAVILSIPGVYWLEGNTLSYGQTISYWPFQQMLRGWADLTDDDDGDSAWSKLESHVQVLFGEETGEYLPFLASLLALPIKGSHDKRVKHLDGETMGTQIYLTTRRFFERLAHNQTTVLVFEDLHWMDESSIALLEHLLPLVENVPLVIIGLSRPERMTPAARLRDFCAQRFADRYIETRLAPLSDHDSIELVRNILEFENPPVRLRELIFKKAEGNPFFLEEVIRTLIDTGSVIRDPTSGRWRETDQIETIDIPDTIQGVITARVDRLSEDVKHVLRVASVIGRSFLYRVLFAIADVGPQLDNYLLDLQQIELIREKQNASELEYVFKHALAQEAIYAGILVQRRRDLHARVAQVLETLFTERLEEISGLLAYHYARAEVWEKAQTYLLKAGDQAGQIAADTEALNHYRQAIAAYSRAFGDRWDPIVRARLERKIGEALFRRGEHSQAVIHFQEALTCLGYNMPISRRKVIGGLVREVIAQFGQRLLPGIFLKAATVTDDPDLEDEILIYWLLVRIDVIANGERFMLHTLRLVNVSERRQSPLGIVLGIQWLSMALIFFKSYRLAERYLQEAVDVANNLRQPLALGIAYYGLQTLDLFRGQINRSIVHGQFAAKVLSQAGDISVWGYSEMFLGYAAAHLGHYGEALERSLALIRTGQESGARDLWTWGLAVHGYVLRRQGHIAEAIDHFRKAIEFSEAIPDHLFRTISGAELGQCFIQEGDWSSAIDVLSKTESIRAQHSSIEPYGILLLRNAQAEATLLAVEHDDPQERSIWLKKAGVACKVALKAATRFPAKAPKALRLQGTYLWLRGKHTAACSWWNRSVAEAEKMGLSYDVGKAHLEIGRRLSEHSHLERAEAIFADLGAELDWKRTRELLGEHFPHIDHYPKIMT